MGLATVLSLLVISSCLRVFCPCAVVPLSMSPCFLLETNGRDGRGSHAVGEVDGTLKSSGEQGLANVSGEKNGLDDGGGDG